MACFMGLPVLSHYKHSLLCCVHVNKFRSLKIDNLDTILMNLKKKKEKEVQGALFVKKLVSERTESTH